MKDAVIEILETGPLVTIQDRGRFGYAHLGVPRAGALDAPAAALANRVVGNHPDDAVLEVLLGGLVLRSTVGRWLAVDGRAVWLPAGEALRVDAPSTGLRSYVAVAGGIAVEPVLGSRSTDTLAGVGPPRVEAGTRLPVGEPRSEPPAFDAPRAPRRGPLRLVPGPRDDWFAADALDVLCGSTYVVEADSNRVGLRLDGPALTRRREGELASEGMVLGAVQVPPSGRPVVFLADHPPTGGYPVIGVVDPEDLWQCAQVRPGEEIRFARSSPGAARG